MTMKFVVAPDSFKGCLSAVQVGETMARALRIECPEASITVVPLADGGEGTVEAVVKAAGGRLVTVRATGPLGDSVESAYGVIREGTPEATAVLEAANTFGLPMVPADRRNPLHATSRGMGDVVRAALDAGLRRFAIGLGGSATNDGGLGMLSSLGARFADANGRPLEGYARDLAAVETVDLGGLDPRLADCRFEALCDVTNPLLGLTGASRVYGPQKGATPELVERLDRDLGRYADRVEAQLSRTLRDRPGSGAAGGLGFAWLALGAELVPGARALEELTDLRRRIAEADWVLTGEGRTDGQTAFGKLPAHVASLAKAAGAETIVISGSLGPDIEPLRDRYAGLFSIAPGPATLEQCLDDAERNLYECTRSVARLLRLASHREPRSPV
ncbi:glycerate kinase [Paenibacillus sp. TRM 82003]|nr:glycerate kinase [Paenibacillus sp. TRM 82003]